MNRNKPYLNETKRYSKYRNMDKEKLIDLCRIYDMDKLTMRKELREIKSKISRFMNKYRIKQLY